MIFTTAPHKISVWTDSCSSSVYIGSLHWSPQPSMSNKFKKLLENKRFVLTLGPNCKTIWNKIYSKIQFTWIMIYWRFCCNQWRHTLAGGVEFHFAYIVTTIFAWKHLLITLEIPWKKFSVVENAAFLCGYSTHFKWWQINVFRFLTHYTFGHVYSAQKWLSKYKSI